MANYIRIRGWLDCNLNEAILIENKILSIINNYQGFEITKEVAEIYTSGWIFPKQTKQWSEQIFYGMDIKSYNLFFFEMQLDECLNNNLGLDGYFILKDEEFMEEIWKIDDDKIHKMNLSSSGNLLD